MTRDFEKIEQIITSYLKRETGYEKGLYEAENYSVLSGGKRVRPALLYHSYMLFNKGVFDEALVGPFLAALEMIHTYSLCHDDLPALDDDDYRRGRLATHKEFGEAAAILAGDGLLNLAYETALKAFDCIGENDNRWRRVKDALCVLAEKSGGSGMLGGQTVDVESECHEIDLETIQFIYKKKTAALMEAPLMMGAILAGAGKADVSHMEELGECLGIAFQIQDDLLDVEGDFDETGKLTGSDSKKEKPTFVVLSGIENSKAEVNALFERADAIIASYGNEFSAGLSEVVDSLKGRRK